MPTNEIVVIGRGGQGAVTSAYVMAKAAFYDGKYSQAFPFFGVERRGAPVMSFCRIDNKEIKLRSQIYTADYIIVLDPTLIGSVNIKERLKKDGSTTLIINSHQIPEELKKMKCDVVNVDATKISLEIIGKPFVNISMLGAFSAVSGLISLSSLKKAIMDVFESKKEIGMLNAKASEAVHKEIKK